MVFLIILNHISDGCIGNKMSFVKVLSKDYKLPPFHSYRQRLFWALLALLLPNVLFWIVGTVLGLGRPIINLDYFLCLVLFALPLPFKLGKILGVITWIISLFIDVLMFVIQFFPFMDFAAIRSLAPFLFQAPTLYIVATFGVAFYALVFPFLLNKVAQKATFKFVLACAIVFGTIGGMVKEVTYRDVAYERFGRSNYFIINSQFFLYDSENQSDFSIFAKTKPQISPNLGNRAISNLQQPLSNKILFIIAESWGVAREKEVQRQILNNIYKQKDNLEFINEGYFEFSGATVQGEMRELCNKAIKNGYAFGMLEDKEFIDCMPYQLKQQGYQTTALHGASGRLYDRVKWYPKAGFSKVLFVENMMNLPKCHAFNGVCDSALTDVVAKEFADAKDSKKFVYWLTLTSHFPYTQTDMHEPGLDCQKYGLFEGDVCNNMRLEAQFFDDLGELIKKPEMKGVEVIVVGDHMPPIINLPSVDALTKAPLHKNLRWSDVSWVHFKVKS